MRVFPGLEHDHMALKLAGTDDRLDLSAFEALARTIDLPLGEARAIIDRLTGVLENPAQGIIFPDALLKNAPAMRRSKESLRLPKGAAEPWRRS
jgi:serine/threonine-protein kinase HipA